MMKRRPCATNLPPSKLCRLLLIVFTLKLGVLGLLVAEPFFKDGADALPGFNFLGFGSGVGTASAATDDAAGAPPALEPTLPGSGSYPGSAPQSADSPGAANSGFGPEGRTLPAISLKNDPVTAEPGAAAGTAATGTHDYLSRRQEDLSRKEQELRVLESELNSRLERMQMLENRLASMIKDAEETKDAKLRHLVDVLSNMKSKQAAAVLETLDPKIAVRVLAGMRGRQAGEILTFVRPEIAAKLTESLTRIQLPLE